MIYVCVIKVTHAFWHYWAAYESCDNNYHAAPPWSPPGICAAASLSPVAGTRQHHRQLALHPDSIWHSVQFYSSHIRSDNHRPGLCHWAGNVHWD